MDLSGQAGSEGAAQGRRRYRRYVSGCSTKVSEDVWQEQQKRVSVSQEATSTTRACWAGASRARRSNLEEGSFERKSTPTAAVAAREEGQDKQGEMVGMDENCSQIRARIAGNANDKLGCNAGRIATGCCGNARRALANEQEAVSEPRQQAQRQAPARGLVLGATRTNGGLLCKQTCLGQAIVCSSQQQLDSCGSSDSGQGGSSSFATAASSLASMRITNSSSCGSSVSSCCSSSSSSASRWSSWSMGTLECRSHSCGPAAPRPHQAISNRCEPGCRGQNAPATGGCHSAEHRRQSWLVGLCATGSGPAVLKPEVGAGTRGVSEADHRAAEQLDGRSHDNHYRLVHSSSASVSASGASESGRTSKEVGLSSQELGDNKREEEETTKSEQRLVIGGEIDRIEFFPGQSEHTGGRLIVHLDVNGLQRAHLMDSELVRVVKSPQIKLDSESGCSAAPTSSASNAETPLGNLRRSSAATLIIELPSRPAEGAESEQAVSDLCDVEQPDVELDEQSSSSTTASSTSASLANLISSDPSTSSDDDEEEGESSDFSDTDHDENCSAGGDRAQFWRLVASETSSSSGQSSPSPARQDCPLAKLIQAADEDPASRPRLLFLQPSLLACSTPVGPRTWPDQSELDNQSEEEINSASSAHENLSFQQPATPSCAATSGPCGRSQARLNSIDEEQNNAGGLTRSQSDASGAGELDAPRSISPASDLALDEDEKRKYNLERAGVLAANEGCSNGSGSDDHDNDDDYFYDDELDTTGRCQSRSSVAAQAPTGAHFGPRQLDDNNNTGKIDNNDRQQQQRADGGSTRSWPSLARLPDHSFSGAPNLALSCARPSTSTCPRIEPTSAPGATYNELELGRLQSEHTLGARPLIVWAPSVRRVSCPVGQLASFSSWRQLWPIEQGLQTLLGAGLERPDAPVCASCLAASQRAGQQPAGVRSRQVSVARPVSPASTECLSSSRKTSRPSLTCSDYFSSFDQASADQTISCQNASLLSLASSTQFGASHQAQLAPEVTSLRDMIVPGTGNGASRSRAYLQPASRRARALPGAAAQRLPMAGELRRQSTITGFDHQKYQASRSPSLCLPRSRRSPSMLGAGGRLGATSPSNLLVSSLQPPITSPTNSTGGSSSPSPTNGAIQRAGMAAGSIGQVGRRNRLESLESDRGSSPSWTASTSSLRSSIGGASSCAPLCHPLPKLARIGSSQAQQAYKPMLGSPMFVNPQHVGAGKLGAGPGQLDPANNNNNNNQHVYFFLCCCQRRRSLNGDQDIRPPTAEQATESARRPLVARPATIGTNGPSSAAQTYHHQQQQQQQQQPQQQQHQQQQELHQQQRQQQEVEVTLAVDTGNAGGLSEPPGTDGPPDNGAGGSGLAESANTHPEASAIKVSHAWPGNMGRLYLRPGCFIANSAQQTHECIDTHIYIFVCLFVCLHGASSLPESRWRTLAWLYLSFRCGRLGHHISPQQNNRPTLVIEIARTPSPWRPCY